MRTNFLATMGIVLTLKKGKTYNTTFKLSVSLLATRCDGKTDCDDNSDELQCSVVEIHSSYNRFLSPPPLEIGSKLRVNMSVKIHSLDNFNTIAGSFACQFTLKLRWYDGRLEFYNLRAKPKTIDPEEFLKIWFPFFRFDNTRKKKISQVDEKSLFKVIKEGKGELSSDKYTENKYIFSGNQNPLSYERFYSTHFECDFSLRQLSSVFTTLKTFQNSKVPKSYL